ncbi:MAG TPA: ArsB/NhaD family transporter [Thermaerobacter sp.]
MESWLLALAVFLVTSILILWRPGGVHEAIPALIGACLVFLTGLVNWHDVGTVARIVSNAALTIISTAVMALVLDAAGFFRWVADRLADRAGGSGRRLFHLVLVLSICLTWFLNNDGSILIGTPIIAALVSRMRLSSKASLAYLLGGCLMASASSSPVGVSNMANLEAMAIAGVSLTEHFTYVVFPAVLGIATCWGLLYATFSRNLPESLPDWAEVTGGAGDPAPSARPVPSPAPGAQARGQGGSPAGTRFMWFAVGVVVAVRAGVFLASGAGIPVPIVPALGALTLLLVGWKRKITNPWAVLPQAPWLLMVFAFGMDLVVFGLRNSGITAYLASLFAPVVNTEPLVASVFPAALTAAISSLLNNHPGMIIGSITLAGIPDISRHALLVSYAGVIVAADLAALFTPVGTLASLLWLHGVRQRGFNYHWADYMKVTVRVIPLSFAVAILGLYAIAIIVMR